FEALACLRRTSAIRIAAGENLGNLMHVRHILAARAVDILQPDVAKMGGLTEVMKARDVARHHHVHFEPHSPLYGPALAATLHAIAATPEAARCEFHFAKLEANALIDAFVPVEGQLPVPMAPGLGVRVDENVLDRYRVE